MSKLSHIPSVGLAVDNTSSNSKSVYLNRKLIGEILTVKGEDNSVVGFQYKPKGSKLKGNVFPTVRACIASLESED